MKTLPHLTSKHPANFLNNQTRSSFLHAHTPRPSAWKSATSHIGCAALMAHALAVASAAEPASADEGWRFEGTDLHLGKTPPISFHGFFSQGFLASSDYDYLGPTTDGSFEFTEMGINATLQPFNRTRIALQGFAFDLGDVGNFTPFLDYGSLEYTFADWIGVRGGRVRRAGGIYNHIQDVDLARTSVLLPQGIYDARWRDFSTSIDGGALFGSIPLGKAGSLSYEAFTGVANLSEEDGGVAKWITDGSPGATVTAFDQPFYVGGQLWWNTPLTGLRAGVSIGEMFDFGYHLNTPVSPVGPFGPINALTHGSGDVFFQQYSLEYTWKSWTFQAEYFTYKFDGENTTSVFSGSTPIQPTTVGPGGVNPDAWYVSAAYRFNKWLEVGSYYTEHYADKDNRSGGPDASQRDLALSFRFDPKDWWILKLEGHFIRGTSLLQDSANNPGAERTEDGWFMLALKTTFSF